MMGILQIPILFTIHEIVTIRKKVNVYEIGYGVVLTQLLTMFLYLWSNKLFFFDVPRDSRLMLIVRSILFAISYTLFLGSMSFLNPVVALICH